MSEFRKRIIDPLYPLLIAAAVIFVLVFSFSRILLAVPEIGSTALALLISVEILAFAALFAATRRIKAVQRAVLLVSALALVGGGIATGATIGIREVEPHASGFHIVAENILFDYDSLQWPADEPVQVALENLDAQIPHNFAVTRDEAGADIVFNGDIFDGVATRTYEVPALEEGNYFFVCIVHPQQMRGPLEVLASVDEPTGGH